jgi:sterol 14-demethylase
MVGLLQILGWITVTIFGAVAVNILYQLLPRAQHEPPRVFHWFPFFGNAVRYGTDPYSFFVSCRAKVRTILDPR